MILLTEARYEFVQQYVNLLEAVEEGIELLNHNYEERNFGSGDRLLKDLINAFVPFSSSNSTMKSIFIKDKLLFEQLSQFQDIQEQVAYLDSVFHDEEEKSEFTRNFFSPAYKEWKKRVYSQIKVYIQN